MSNDIGTIKSIDLTNDDNGLEVLRITVDFQVGFAPDLKFAAMFYKMPVRVVLAEGTARSDA